MIILLVSYLVLLVGFFAYSAAGIYHLWRFGYVGDLTKPAILIYVFASLAVIILTLIGMIFRPWPATL